MDFELQTQEVKKIEFDLNFQGQQTFGENMNNSPKFYLDMIFMNVNLDGHTCMPKFGVPLHVRLTWLGKLIRNI